MLHFAGLGLRERRRKWCMLEDDFKTTRKLSKCNASLDGACEFKVNCILWWAGRRKTQHLTCFARLSLRKPNSATPIFPSKSQQTVNAILCWDGYSKCHIYVSPAFSALLRTVLCAWLSSTRSKSLIVRASLWSTSFVRLHSRLRRDMRI